MSKNTLPRFSLTFLGLDKILEQNFCILHTPLGVNLYSELWKAFGLCSSEVDQPSNSAQLTNAKVKDPGHHCRKLSLQCHIFQT